MDKFYGEVLKANGDAVSGATITVKLAGTSTLATLYADDETTPLANPLTSNGLGMYAFCAADAAYDIHIAWGGTTTVLTKVRLLSPTYDMPVFYAGKPGNSAILARFHMVRGIQLPANFVGSVADCLTPATASTVLTILKNDTVTLGTITFGIGATHGTFSIQIAQSLLPSDTISIVNQALADATLAGLSITLAGTR